MLLYYHYLSDYYYAKSPSSKETFHIFQYGGFLSHGGNPSSHPFFKRFFHHK